MIDSHCHLDVERFDTDRHDVLQRAWAAGLKGIVIPAIGPHVWNSLLSWPSLDPRIQVALGIHPQWLPELPESEDDVHLQTLDTLLSQGRAIAVGECGLDGDTAPNASMERQIRVLRAHLNLARKHQLPILIHCLRAHPVLLDLLKHESPVPSGILLHSYSGGAELAKDYVSLGCHFSFAGPVTYDKARKPLDAVRAIPRDRLLVETDSPDQSPTPHRGQRNEPSYLPLIISAMAKAIDMDERSMTDILTNNTTRFFNCRFGT